jgi:hypothetical protein
MSRLRPLLMLLCLLGSSAPLPALAQPRPRIEVAFALDTTGSMGSYIEEARTRIRAIARGLAEGEPAPDIRFGLVEFRDKSDAFVTREHAFTGDLAEMQRYLDGASADGGGDAPEAVLEGLASAIRKLGWTPLAANDGVIRLLYLVGDAEAQHYPTSPKEGQIEAEARARGIVIHALVCGGSADSIGFEPLARHTEGRTFALAEQARDIAGASTLGLGAAVAATTRAYSSSAGVHFDEHKGKKVDSKILSAGKVEHSGLLGGEARWVSDPATFSDLWAIHMSVLPRAARPPLPSVDFASQRVLVLGGEDAGLELVAVLAQDEVRRADVRSAARGVRFVIVPEQGKK